MPQAMLLDISLPDIDGWRVLHRMKHDLALRHIPVYIVSTIDHPERGIKLGARGVLSNRFQTAKSLEHFLVEYPQFPRSSTSAASCYWSPTPNAARNWWNN